MKTKIFTHSLSALVFVLTLLPALVAAQNTRQEMHADRVALSWRLAADLQSTLTKEQKAQLFERMERTKGRHQDALGLGDPFMNARRAGRGIGTNPLGPIGNVLTEDQKQSLMQKYRAEMPGSQMREVHQRAMAEALNLTARQQEQLTTLRAETQSKIQALRDNSKSSNRSTNRTAMQQIMEESEATHARILTPQQLETVKIHRAMVAGKKMNRAAVPNQRMKKAGIRHERSGFMQNRSRGFRGMRGRF